MENNNNQAGTGIILVAESVKNHFSNIVDFIEKAKGIHIFTSDNATRQFDTFIPTFELLEIATKNDILNSMPQYVFKNNTHNDANSAVKKLSEQNVNPFFDTYFAPLKQFGITTETTETEIINVAQRSKENFDESHYMFKVIDQHTQAWIGVKKTFKFINYLSSLNAFTSAHFNGFTTFTRVFTSNPDLDSRCRIASAYGALCEINMNMGVHEVPEILSTNEIRQILFAAPVLFSSDVLTGQKQVIDEKIHASVAEMLKLTVPEQILLSVFNDVSAQKGDYNEAFISLRNLSKLPLHETYPNDIAIKKKTLSDMNLKMIQTIILTPYTDFRLKEMNDPNWSRYKPIDPYAITFFEGIPYGIMIRRWSGHGALHAITQMTANTILFLQKAKDT